METPHTAREAVGRQAGVGLAHQAQQPRTVSLELEPSSQKLQPRAKRPARALPEWVRWRCGERAAPPYRLSTRGSH